VHSRRLASLVVSIVLLLAACPASAQDRWGFILFPKPNGTPLGEVRDIVEGADGSIWVATWGDGLHRIHKAEWHDYYESEGLADDWMKSLAMDERGVVWVGTGEGLCRVRDGKIDTYRTDTLSGITNREVDLVRVISGDRLCVTTPSGEVATLQVETGALHRRAWEVLATTEQTGGRQPLDLIELPDGRLWVSLIGGGVREYDGTRWRHVYGDGQSCFLVLDSSGAGHPLVWLVDQASQGVVQYDGDSWTEIGEIAAYVNSAALGPKGRLWLGTDNGVRVLTDGGWRAVDLGREVGNPLVRVIRFDSQGRLWLGTNEGLALGKLSAWNPDHYTSDGSQVRFIVKQPAVHEPMVGIDEGGRLVHHTGDFWTPGLQLHLTKAFISWWAFPPGETLWGLSHEDVTEFSASTGRPLRSLPLPTRNDIGENELFRTSGGELWLLTAVGAFQVDGTELIPIPPDKDYVRQGAYTAFELSEREFLVGVYNGVERWRDGVKVENITLDRGLPELLDVQAICQVDDNRFWFATYGYGIQVFDGESIEHLQPDKDLLSTLVSNIHKGQDGTIWISFRHTGAASYRHGRWVTYSHRQGLPNSSVISIHEDPEGRIWLATRSEGILSYRPNHDPPETFIDAAPDTVAPHGIGVFTFSGRDSWYQTPNTNLLFSWRIMPVGSTDPPTDWSPFQGNVTAVTSPLPSGEYAFEVHASDDDRNVDPSPARHLFRVELPFWREPVFLGSLAVLGLVTCAALLVALRLRLRGKGLEQERERSNERLRAIIANTPGAVYQARLGPSFGMVLVSEAIEDITGYSPRDFVESHARTFDSIIHPDDLEAVRALRDEQLDRNGTFALEYRIRDAQNRERWVSDRGRAVENGAGAPDLVDGVLVDITELKHAEQAAAQLATVVEQAAEEIIITDAEGMIQYVNPAFERISGYTSKEVMGRNPNLLRSGVHGEGFYKDLWSTIRSGRVWSGHITSKARDGQLVQEDATFSPIKGAGGRIIGYVAVKRDVTESVAMETRFRQRQKMEAVGTLAGGIAHDFNNILSAIMGYAEIMLHDLAAGEPCEEASLREILKAGERARELIRRILTFSRKGTTERIPVNVGTLIRDAVKLLRGALPSTVGIRESIAVDGVSALADPTELHQVIMNLCTNAWQAMRETGGVLEVTLAPVDLDEADEARTAVRPGAYIQLIVRDTGCGIRKADTERVFEPFYTTKERGQGTGMGLAMVHGIVRDHGGSVSVRSEVGKGSQFEVLIPRLPGEEANAPDAEAPSLEGHERILVVDDERALVEVERRTLQTMGYKVVAVNGAVEAYEAIAADPGGFDLVLTDLTMPVMTGLELAARIRQIRPDIPLVLLTGYGDAMTPEKLEEAGFQEMLMKPLRRRELGESLRRVLDSRTK
jgi:PAS domain S-box-containing protein